MKNLTKKISALQAYILGAAALSAALFLSADITAGASSYSFADVAAGSYYHNAVYWAAEKGVTTGAGDGFSPDAPCTRAQVMTFLWHAMGDPSPGVSSGVFSDVKKGSYYEKAVAWAYENGITTGKTATTFDPEGTCTRAEFVTFLYSASGRPAVSGESSFEDVAAGQYFEKPVIWAVANGITSGTSASTFSPSLTCTRAQVVTFLYVWYTRNTTAASASGNLVDVTSFGAVSGDGGDDKQAINSAIENALSTGKDTVFIPAGNYNVSIADGIGVNIYGKRDLHLIMDPGAVIDTMPTDAGTFGTIYIRNAENITVHGGQVIGGRDNHIGDYGEWGNGIMFLDSKNVTVSNTVIQNTWGDGIYLGTRRIDEAGHGNSNIVISGCSVSNARRSSVSIVDADFLSITGCTLRDANGIAPQAGINIEPNPNSAGEYPYDVVCSHIRINSTHITAPSRNDYNGQFFCFRTQYYPGSGTVTADDVVISGCTFVGDAGNYSGTNVRIVNSTIDGTFNDRMGTSLENTSCGDVYRF